MMSSPDETTRKKRLLWRATHRGIKEMDLILGGFVSRNIDSLAMPEIAELETIMDIPDQDMLAWATKQQPLPEGLATPLLLRILDYPS